MTPQELFQSVASHYAYDPQTGQITRRGDPIGGLTSDGYVRINVRKTSFFAHRVAWFLTYGEWPSGQIDHINGDRADNRLANLRDVTPSLNRMNQCLRSDNRSGVPGVTFASKKRRWQAQICVEGRHSHLGTFLTREAAIEARLAAQRDAPFGPNHGARP